jgi:dihydroflavonol-4-reductase
MRLFLTGATGFIGSCLANLLAAEGHQLRCLVRPASLAGRGARLAELGEIVPGELCDRAALQAGLAGCDAVVHLAGAYEMWLPERGVFDRVNIEGTRAVMESALVCGVGRVINVSTVAVYGKPRCIPFNEDDLPGPRAFSDYGRSKFIADRIAWDCAARGLALTAFYPGIVLGAGDRKASGRYIDDLVHRRCPSTIYHHSIATYVYVGDVARAIANALARPESAGQKYLLGGAALDGRAYARLISDVSGVPLPWFHFPDWMVTAAAYLLTWRANAFTHRPPPWGLSIDAAWTLHHGFHFDGSRAARELVFHYTPIHKALSEEISGLLKPDRGI